ncbi:hypothetical protein KIN20_036863 [Parelaphostrongylus tenuis]|uniref:Uncharacterized protein n=1 Tax=Parelaphostrongylus tenuis TaxID=148309 RepID=A0AAD5RDF3_PARTN|nr:hypothetical protein KIN20_036863 [Parelaphostrongylus tenuis]
MEASSCLDSLAGLRVVWTDLLQKSNARRNPQATTLPSVSLFSKKIPPFLKDVPTDDGAFMSWAAAPTHIIAEKQERKPRSFKQILLCT